MSDTQQQLKQLTDQERENRELNTCDKCDWVMHTEHLIWLCDDFTPKAGELVPASTYKQYDALCEDCYLDELVN